MKLDKTNGKIAGVCAGMAKELNQDAGMVRLGWIVAALLTAAFPVIIAYIVMAMIMDE